MGKFGQLHRLLLQTIGIQHKFKDAHNQHTTFVIVRCWCILRNNDFLESVAGHHQRALFLFHFCLIRDSVSRLNIVTFGAFVAYEIYFILLADAASIFASAVYHHNANIHIEASDFQLIENDILHRVGFLQLTEVQTCVAKPHIGEIVFNRGVDILFSLDIITHCTVNQKRITQIFDISGKTDDYAHTGTASAGDTIDYQIVSTLPSITSKATYLSCYTFIDALSAGLTYTKGDVVLGIFSDTACKNAVTTWKETDGYFTVSYNDADGKTAMTVEMTAKGLAEINKSKAVYTDTSMVNSGYSDCTMRLTYTAKVDSDNSLVVGDKGNDNKVVLAWKRTSETFYDTLVDDAHIYTYGIDLTKLFSDGKGDFSKIEFLVQNKTDNYYVQAKLNQDEGVYYVTGHTENKADATHFVPVKTGDTKGRILIKGLEDDTYTMTEVRTDNGYVLLKQDIEVVISQKESTESCTIYASDALGLIQNDPRYAKVIQSDADLKNIPQKHLEHKLLTASATVSGKNVNMTEDNGSANAEAPLTVVNTRGFDLPKTGDNGTMMFTIVGILLMVGAAVVLYAVSSKKSA